MSASLWTGTVQRAEQPGRLCGKVLAAPPLCLATRIHKAWQRVSSPQLDGRQPSHATTPAISWKNADGKMNGDFSICRNVNGSSLSCRSLIYGRGMEILREICRAISADLSCFSGERRVRSAFLLFLAQGQCMSYNAIISCSRKKTNNNNIGLEQR